MSVVLRCWPTLLARDAGEKSLGYLRSFGPEAAVVAGAYPTGEATFTAEVADALRFASRSEAFDFWRQLSKTCPRRPDGQPNRPLTAFSINFEQHPPNGNRMT